MAKKADPRTIGAGVDDADARRTIRRHAAGDEKASHDFAVEAARFIADSHCIDVLLLDTRGVSQVTDFIIIATGTSDRQISSVGDDVSKLARPLGFTRYGSEQDTRTTWLVLDFVDVIVHLFEPTARAHYDLEMMWGDVPRIEWQRTRGERTKS